MPILALEFPPFEWLSTTTSVTVLWFFLAVLLLDSFDISLPRGDSIGVSGALCAAAVILLGPMWAALICLGSVLVTHLARHGAEERRRVVGAVVARCAALGASALTAYGLSLYPVLYRSLLDAGLVAAAFLMTELIAAQLMAAVGTGRPFGRLLRGNLRVQAPLLLAQWSASVLLLITFQGMGAWSLIPVVALLFLMRQSYAMLQDIRELYRTTVGVLVEAAEGQDARRVGHAERTAATARAIAMRVGLSAHQVDRINYAALLHDVDAIGDTSGIAVPSDGYGTEAVVGTSSEVFDGVHFFDDVLPIIRICDGHSSGEMVDAEGDLLAGLIVALASDVDAAEHADVAAAHVGSSVDRVAARVSPSTKSLVVGAALALGYGIPAVN
ncbi:MAG: hypothetical protein WCJ13_01445 [Coriobacteriia bacterium]